MKNISTTTENFITALEELVKADYSLLCAFGGEDGFDRYKRSGLFDRITELTEMVKKEIGDSMEEHLGESNCNIL